MLARIEIYTGKLDLGYEPCAVIRRHTPCLEFQYYFKNLKVGWGFYAKTTADSDSPHKNYGI